MIELLLNNSLSTVILEFDLIANAIASLGREDNVTLPSNVFNVISAKYVLSFMSTIQTSEIDAFKDSTISISRSCVCGLG